MSLGRVGTAAGASELELLIKSFLGSCLVAFSSQVVIPLTPVPLTLQTLSVLLVASMLGSRGGVLAVAFYLAEGVVGFPVFAAYSSGIKVILGPTGGYLLGFIPAAYVTGRLLEKIQKERIFQIFLAGLAGELVLFAVGYLQLAYFCGVSKAYVYGVAPFLLGDLLKLIAFSLLVRKK